MYQRIINAMHDGTLTPHDVMAILAAIETVKAAPMNHEFVKDHYGTIALANIMDCTR